MPDVPEDGVTTLLIGTRDRRTEPAALSWEQFTRWLEEISASYDPESRSGFLLNQFRQYLPTVGITCFPGFQPDQLATVADALQQLTSFYAVAADLFNRFGQPAPQELQLLRESRAEDLLAGYCYRDYAKPGSDGQAFIRLGFHVSSAQLQIAFWFVPGSKAQRHLMTALHTESPAVAALMDLKPDPLLRLWSPEAEQLLPLKELEPGQVAGLVDEGYTAAVQVNHPFSDLVSEGLVERVQNWTAELMESVRPFLADVVH